MKKFYASGLAVFCALLGLFFVQPILFHGTSSASTPGKADIHARLQRLSVPFVSNQGQTDKQVKFYASTFGGTVFVTEAGEIVYSLPTVDKNHFMAGSIIKEKPANAKMQVVTGEERAAATINYFKGNNKAQWKRNLPTYDVVNLGEIYKGVDLKLRAYGNNVEKLFYVRPQADPAAIAMTVEGAQRLKVNKHGELEVVTARGPVRFTKPAAYQQINGKRIEVAAAYTIIPQSAIQNPQLSYGFTIGAYDKTRELVIDPLLASTYLGGSDREGSALNTAFAMSVFVSPKNGDVYIAGFTDSANFPTPFNTGFQNNSNRPVGTNAFVSRFDRGLTNLVTSTYLGGSGTDLATVLAIDSAGNVYVTGQTASANFPTVNPFQATSGGGTDAFVSILNADLTSLLASTYLGGTGEDRAFSLIVDQSGVYVGGDTSSTTLATAGSADATFNGITDGFIARLGANLSTLTALTYFGGSGDDSVNTMAVSGVNVYAAGSTSSTDIQMVFPIQFSNQGGTDAFLAKLSTSLGAGSIAASTYLGGTGTDRAFSIAVSPSGSVFVAGDTSSPGIATTGDIFNAGVDGFVARLNADFDSLTLTYLGGSGEDHAYSLAIAGANVYVAGDTTSTDFPVSAGSFDTTFNGISDVFLAKFNDTLTDAPAATYLGGSNNDFANAVTLDIFSNNVYVTGFSFSADLPTTDTAFSRNNAGVSDAFISVFDANFSAGIAETIPPSAPTNLGAAAANDIQINLLWDASTDNIGVTGYEVWRGDTKIATITSTSYSDTGLTPSTAYSYRVKAIDASNNASAFSNTATATTLAEPDTTPPLAPTNLFAAAASDTRISLTWTASTDVGGGVLSYKVYRVDAGDIEIATVPAGTGTTILYSDGGLSPSTTYTYTVKAVDGAGNISAASNPATMTTSAPGAVAGDGGGGGGGGGGCFIATAAYGSYMADDVMVLRRFRDDHLMTSAAGRAFVNLYYTLSPPVANFIARHETLRTATRAALSPLVYGVKYPLAAMLMLLLVCMGGVVGVSMRRGRIRG
jgi:chitodextrinase